MVALIIALPFALSLFLASASLSYLITQKAQKLHSCRTEVLRLQQKLRIALKSLLALNPRAHLLEKQIRKTQLKLATALAAGNAPAIAALKMELAFLKSQQFLLAAQQRQILEGADAARRIWRASFQANSKADFGFPQALAVTPLGNSPAPAYQLRPNFEKDQKVTLTGMWRGRVWSLIESGINMPARLTWQCAATLEKEYPWESRLAKAK